MLVLSRKPHEKILIPAIQACIHVAAVRPGVVRVAINAPPEVAVLRGELANREAELRLPVQQPAAPVVAKSPRPGRRLRARLRVASMTLGLARLQLCTGGNREAAAVLEKVHRQIQALSRHLDRKKANPQPRSAAKLGVPERSAALQSPAPAPTLERASTSTEWVLSCQ